MISLSRKHIAIGVIAASILLLVYALLGSSDEDRVMERLKELASAVETKEGESLVFRTARINGVFKEALEKNAALTSPELGTTTGRQELAALAGQATRLSPEFQVSLGETDVRLEGEEARVVSVVTLTGTRDGELRRDQRHVRFLLRKTDGDWRVAAIDVEAKSEDQPEARP
ncbi:MAG TPA: hypothetical protein VGK73_27830 [Polyangiaceae bacterium]